MNVNVEGTRDCKADMSRLPRWALRSGSEQPRASTNAPTPADIAMNATRRAELLRGRIAPLDLELTRLRGEMSKAPVGSTSRQRYKDRAKQVLRQKKTLEKRLESALNQQFNMAMIEDAKEAQEAARNDAAMYASMRASLGMPGGSVKGGELDEAMAQNAELQEILSQPLDVYGEGMDDETLEAELQAELEADLQAEHVMSARTPAHGGRHGSEALHLSADAQRVAAVPRFNAPPCPLPDNETQDHLGRIGEAARRPQTWDPRYRR